MKHHFFTFELPILKSFADFLIEKFAFNLKNVNIILSSKRAQRRLLEILTEQAATKKKLLQPPSFFTPKKFCDAFTSKINDNQIATEIEQTIALINAAKKCEDAVNSIIVNKTFVNERDFFRIAQLIMTLHKTLSGEGLTIKQISENSIIETYDEEKKRWAALEKIETAYHNELEKNGLTDPYKALSQAITAARENQHQIFDNLFVVNVIESFKLFKEAIETQDSNLTIISLGEKTYFDDFGFLNTEKINDEKLNFKEQNIKFFNTPKEQAEEILNVISNYSKNCGYGDFVVAAPNTDFHLSIEQALLSAGLNVHNAAGIPFNQTEIGILFLSLANCFEDAGCETESFLSLIKHPVIENFIMAQLKINDVEYYDKLIKKFFSNACYHKIEFINNETAHFFDEETKKLIEIVFNKIISPLESESTISNIPGKINLILEQVFSANKTLPESSRSSIHEDALENWLRLTDAIESSKIKWDEKCNTKTAIIRFLLLLKNSNLIPKSLGPVIDITGWLEIAADDAPITIVAGFNEGSVPEKFSADAFLPNTLREKLDLPNYKKRFLRDKFLTKCLLEKPGECYFFACRRSTENEALKPSKILFCQEFEKQIKILKDFYAEEGSKEKDEVQSTNFADCNRQKMSIENSKEKKAKIELPKGIKLDLDFLNTLSVSAINDYLSCPYKFFLKRVCKIYAPDEFSAELEGLDIGNLIHETIYENLENLHSDKSEEEIITILTAHFERKTEEKFGKNINPAIIIQLENLKRRLKAFVPAFREDFSEWSPVKDESGKIMAEYEIFPEIETNAGKVKINGKVDLIEKCGDSYRVIDFKTGKKEKMYASKKKKWLNVQLILYALWVKQKFGKEPEIGFFHIPSDIKKIKYNAEDLAVLENPSEDAINTVKEILEKIIDEKISLEDKFEQAETAAACRYCDYKHLCER